MTEPNLDIHLFAVMARDADAFGAWMAGAEDSVRQSLASFARVVDVEAVLQESLLRVWQVAPRFVPDGAPNGLLRLAIRIARNLAISEVRKNKSRPVESSELERSPEMIDAPAPPDPLLRRVLEKCLELLPDQPKKVLMLRFAGGAEDSELAERAHMRLNTFLQNVGRARKLLGECLRKNGVAVGEELVA